MRFWGRRPQERAAVAHDEPAVIHLPFEPTVGEPPKIDAFASSGVALALADLVSKKVRPPYTISISGAWGVGKTTLMDQMLAVLEERENHTGSDPTRSAPLSVRLDLWCQEVQDLRRSIAIEVGAASETGSRRLRQGGKAADKARRTVADALDNETRTTITRPEPSIGILRTVWHHPLRAVSMALMVVIAGLLYWYVEQHSPASWRTVLKDMIPALVSWSLVWIALALGLVTVTRSIAPAAERVALGRELRRRVSVELPRRVVVVIDNLDRLQGQDALETLAEIRTFVEVPDGQCVFVIPIDRDAFVEHCRRLGMDEPVARDYLEKFFNLNVLLTKPAQTDLRDWTRRLLVECLGEDDDRRYLAEIIADAADGSPRAARRIVSGVVARRLLLDRLTHSISLQQIALIEGLVSRFPFVLEELSLRPRVLPEVRAELSKTSEDVVRMAAISALSPEEHRLPPDEQSRSRDLKALRTFLMAHRSVPLTTDDVALILSLREDRDWFGIGRSEPLRSALAGGDAAGFSADLAERESGDRAAAVSTAVRLVREDCSSEWYTGAINGLNAIATSVEAGADTDALRDAARDVLFRVKPEQFATLSVEAIQFACASPNNDRRLQFATDVAAWTLRKSDPPLDPTAAIEMLRLASDFISESQLLDIRQNLARRPFSQTATLLVPGEHVQQLLPGPVLEREYDILKTWDAAEPDHHDVINDCLDRLLKLQELGVSNSASLADVVVKVTASVSVADAAWLPEYEKLVRLLEDLPSSDATDALATAWAVWPHATADGLLLAMRLHLGPSATEHVSREVRSGLLTASLDQVADFVNRARSLGLDGVDQALAERWATTGDAGFASLVADGGDAALCLLVAQLAGAESKPSHWKLLQDVADLVVEHHAGEAAATLVAEMADQIKRNGLVQIEEMTSVLWQLRHSDIGGGTVDVTPVIAAIEGLRLRPRTESEFPHLARATREFDNRGLDPDGGLALSLLARSSSLSHLDWETAPWLARHPKVKAGRFLDTLVRVINGSEAVAELVAHLPELRAPLRGSARVTSSLILKIADGDPSTIAEVLPRLRGWRSPKRSPGLGFIQAVETIERKCPGVLGRVGRIDLVALVVNTRAPS